VVSFGRAIMPMCGCSMRRPAGSLVTAQLGGFGDGADAGKLCYTVAPPGDHWVINSLAVMAAVRAVGGDLGAAGLALAEMEGLAGRGARHQVSRKMATAARPCSSTKATMPIRPRWR
jgi:hypothetical protein